MAPLTRPNPERWLAFALTLVVCSLAGFPPAANAAQPTCAGKPATIVADTARIAGSKANDVIVAGPGNSAIYGGGGNDTICAGGGADTIYGGRGNDAMFGEAGDDAIYGDRGSDQADGGAGSDSIYGEFGNDRLAGGAGDGDTLDGGPGDDSLDGGPGNLDTLAGGPGSDRIEGGPGGHDVASYKEAGGPLSIDLGAGTVSGAEQEQLSGIEDVLGGAAGDTVVGSAAPNRLDGGSGDDRLVAVGSGDEAFGGPGGDECSGPFSSEDSCGPETAARGIAVELHRSITGSASLVISGSNRAEQLTVSYAAGGYLVQGAGTSQVSLGAPDSNACQRDRADNSVLCHGEVSSIDAALRGGDDGFTVDASVPESVTATVDGGSGSDSLSGGAGGDTLYGGADSKPDWLSGGPGDDVLFGINIFHPRRDSGAATMAGGAGDDLMIGGQPCEGDVFEGGPGENDSASFARVRNGGIHVEATIGGEVRDPDLGGACTPGRIDASTEKIEGSPGPDILIGLNNPNTLMGRGGNDLLDGRGGFDRCIGGAGGNRLVRCESDTWAKRPRPR